MAAFGPGTGITAKPASRTAATARARQLALGATPLLAVSLLPALMATYHERYPGVDLRLLEASADVLLNSLREAWSQIAPGAQQFAA